MYKLLIKNLLFQFISITKTGAASQAQQARQEQNYFLEPYVKQNR